ncbi:MAG: hypothetical protein JST80_08100 [Bdellovibrionales bacterium]|nr:hypothetical protein [Bdellovibrionales bacterium]
MKIKRFVRQSLFLMLLAIYASDTVKAQDLPPIDTHRFTSTPVEVSSSGRVYKFSMKSADVPRVGNIVLIQEQKKAAMALRVIKSDPNKMEYIARRVRRYDDHQTLIVNRNYESVEKVADKINTPPVGQEPIDGEPLAQAALVTEPEPVIQATPEPTPVPKSTPRLVVRPVIKKVVPTPTPIIIYATPAPTPEPTPEPVAEIQVPKTIEPPLEVTQLDQRLDESTTPQNHESNIEVIDKDNTDDATSPYEINESKRFDPFKNMISITTGSFRNASNFVLGGEMFGGFTLAYSRKLRDDWLISKVPAPQDALWVEFALGYYRKANLTNDVYTVVPLHAELRWELNFSSTLALELYTGLQYNWIMSMDNVDLNNVGMTNTVQNLNGPQVTVGLGLIFNVGPQWYIRSDLGWDRLVLGLGVRW